MVIKRRELLLGAGMAAAYGLAAKAAKPVTAEPGATSLTAAADGASTEDSAPLAAQWQALDQIVTQTIAKQRSAGMAMAVWQAGRACYQREAGWANLETDTPVQADSGFRIGSLTKQFCAALCVKLASAGVLKLDTAAAEYLGFLREAPAFTLRELLNHTAGVRDLEGDGCGLAGSNALQVAQQIAAQPELLEFAPGSAWHYSNANYQILGAVLEQVSGQSLAALAQELLLAPANLTHTAFDHSRTIVPGRVTGYTPDEGAPGWPFSHAEHFAVELAGAAGAMRSTASDLCRWHQALMAGSVLTDSEWALMLSPGLLRDGSPARSRRFDPVDEPMGATEYGMGLLLDRQSAHDGGLIISHHGGINGFCAFLASHVPSRLSYAVLFNVDTYPGLPLRDIRRAVFAGLLT